MFEIRYLSPAKKYFKKLKEKGLKQKYYEVIQHLVRDPYQGELKKGDLAGLRTTRFHHNQVEYRIAYYIEEDKDSSLVIILSAGTRENFYEDIKQY